MEEGWWRRGGGEGMGDDADILTLPCTSIYTYEKLHQASSPSPRGSDAAFSK